jgi:chromosome segregation ATPase
MRGTKYLFIAFALTFLLGGCFGASTDPHEGGLFGYSPEAYEQRQEARRTQLQGLEADTRRKKADAQALEGERAGKEKKYASLQKQSEALNRDVAALSRKLKGLKAETAEQQKQLDALKKQAAGLSGSAERAQGAGGDEAARQARLEELRRRLEQLEQEAEALGSL